MTSEYTPTAEMFRAVYAHMLAEWCREDSLAEFDRLIDRVRREAKIKALRGAANDLDLSTRADINNLIGRPAPSFKTSDRVADILWLGVRADQLEQEGKNDD